MNRDEIRALIGGYATGSLTEMERRALFDAALDDQELFDELAREQALKEMIDQPGARERLIRSLEPVRAAVWWKRPWPWAAAAAVVTIVAILMLRPAHRTEIARVEQPRIEPRVESAPSTPPSPATPPAVPKRKAKLPPKRVVALAAPVQKDTAVIGTGSGLGGAPSAGLPAAPVPQAAPLIQPRAEAIGTVAGASSAGRPAAPVPQAAPLIQPRAGAIGGMVSGLLARPFGFHYTMDWNGDATVTADADGYLSILANQNDSVLPMFSSGRVRAGSITHVRVPAGIDAIVIQFTASPPDSSLESSPITQTTEASGALADPAPSPASKLRIRITAK